MDDINLTFGRLEALLANYFQIDPDRAGTFRARIKQLQRLNFPSGVNVGRGARFAYEIDHTIKLVFALELLSHGIPAKLATEIVEAGWDRIQVALQLCCGPLFGEDLDDIFCWIKTELLSDSISKDRYIEVCDLSHFKHQFYDKNRVLAGSLTVNVSHMIRRILISGERVRLKRSMVLLEIKHWKTLLPSLDIFGDGWMWVDFSRQELCTNRDHDPKA